MGTIYLVRHGQASLGADNYDQLSALGYRQSHRLGEYFAQTLEGISKGMGLSLGPDLAPSLNEYDSHAIIQSIYPHPLEKPDRPEQVQAYFRLLRDGLLQWMQGTIHPEGMPSYKDFEAGIISVLDALRQSNHKNVLLVSSGGPISTAIGHVLGVAHPARIALNLQIRNSAVSEFHFTAKQHSLVSYNTLPHLEPVEHKSWITYA